MTRATTADPRGPTSMRRSKATAAALSIALVLVAGLASTAMAGSPSGADNAKAKAEHDRIVHYWTAERIAGAIPRDFERTTGGKLVPKARPGGGGGTPSGAVTGASWTLGTTIFQRTGKV